jgi:uncharacterized membrane protein YeaQ/YmgE (transglycosylase-associated protein family)
MTTPSLDIGASIEAPVDKPSSSKAGLQNRFVCTNPVTAKSARRCAGERQKADHLAVPRYFPEGPAMEQSSSPAVPLRERGQWSSPMPSRWSLKMENAANTAPYMGLISWIILGLIAGFLGSKIVNKTGEGLILDIVLGVVGAVLGGYLFNLFGAQGVTGLNLWSLLVAVIGAIVVLMIYRLVIGGGRLAPPRSRI